ncbi:MAG TPA: DUF1839 family protein [Gemmatimonadales bacterium]|nr:DUF1839 family protein [Gemmatimonadales bacterium]
MSEPGVAASVAVRPPHALHRADRTWEQTNCSLDLWIELLHHLGLEPLAAFGCAVRLDFEGDQYTFLKVPGADLEALYGIDVQELAIWRPLLDHVLEQTGRGRVVMPEVDAWFLPDTRGISYRLDHVKTTIAIAHIHPIERRLDYFHNSGHHALGDADFDGLFRPPAEAGTALPPFVEIAKLDRLVAHPPSELARRATILLEHHVARRPRENPIAAHRARIAEDLALLRGASFETFHHYAFATVRQLGACFGLLAAHLRWLEALDHPELARAAEGCEAIETSAKALEFTLARAVATGRLSAVAPLLERMEQSWAEVMAELVRTHGH